MLFLKHPSNFKMDFCIVIMKVLDKEGMCE